VERSGNLEVVGNQLRASTTVLSLATISNLSVSNVDLSLDVNLIAGTGQRNFALVARYAGPGNQNMYFARIARREGLFFAEIVRDLAGVRTTLTSTQVLQPSGTMRFQVVGSSLVLFYDGQLVGNAIDSAIAGPGLFGVQGINAVADNFSAVQPVIPAPQNAALPYSDAFNGSDGTSIGATWTERLGDFVRNAGRVTANTAALSLATLNGVNLLNSVQRLDVDLTAGTGQRNMGLVARYSGAGDQNFYLARIARREGLFFAEIVRDVNGVRTTLSSTQIAPSAGTLRFDVIGSALTIRFNGVVVGTATDTAIAAAGAVGIRGINSSADNYNALSA
jgi:hypothetical protein